LQICGFAFIHIGQCSTASKQLVNFVAFSFLLKFWDGGNNGEIERFEP